MLSALSINNIVLIDKLDIELSNGLSVLTGETGAGKSILLDALTLALGGRGDLSLVREGQESGSVIAEIYLPEHHCAQKILQSADITSEENIHLKRVQYRDGRTRSFINDQSVSASLLSKIGKLIVEIHGQHDSRALVDGAVHRDLLDDFGRLNSKALKVSSAYKSLEEANEAFKICQEKIIKAANDEEYASHSVQELLSFGAVIGEEEKLSSERQKMMQLEKIAGEVNDADEILNSNSSPGAMLSSLMRRLERKSDAGAGLFAPILEALDDSLLAIDRISEALEELKRDMVFDENDLENTEERLFGLRALARKYNVRCDELPDILKYYQNQLEQLHNSEAELKELEKKSIKAHKDYLQKASELSLARKKTAQELEIAVNKELPDLKLGAAKFIVEHNVEEKQISIHGFDRIAFYVQTNPGTSPGPMMKVASGGELSRFLLALKVVLADRGSAPVLIFDEIDTGVGGAVADAIGRRLARLAQKVQVICVTHAPQVAARAKSHLLIEKHIDEESKTVRTNVIKLDGAAKNEEIARMLAGANITDEARAAAKRLISEVE